MPGPPNLHPTGPSPEVYRKGPLGVWGPGGHQQGPHLQGTTPGQGHPQGEVQGAQCWAPLPSAPWDGGTRPQQLPASSCPPSPQPSPPLPPHRPGQVEQVASYSPDWTGTPWPPARLVVLCKAPPPPGALGVPVGPSQSAPRLPQRTFPQHRDDTPTATEKAEVPGRGTRRAWGSRSEG